jgi:hypothetical protein
MAVRRTVSSQAVITTKGTKLRRPMNVRGSRPTRNILRTVSG